MFDHPPAPCRLDSAGIAGAKTSEQMACIQTMAMNRVAPSHSVVRATRLLYLFIYPLYLVSRVLGATLTKFER